MIKEQIISKDYKNEKGELSIQFIGETNKTKEETNRILDICFKELSNLSEPVEIVTLIRTIFQSNKEKELKVLIKDNDNQKELSLKFMETKLTELNQKKDNSWIIDYKINEELNVYPLDKIDEKAVANTYTSISVLSLIDSLNDIKPKELNNYEKRMCAIYKSFYDEYPDFSKEETNIKIQAMSALLLYTHKIILEKNFELTTYKGKNVPFSPSLNKMSINLIPFGKINDINELEDLDDYLKKLIIAIKSVIKEITPEGEDELDTIINLSYIFYLTKGKLAISSNKKISEIVSKTEYSKEELTNILIKIKRRTRQVSKENALKKYNKI